MAAGDTGLLDVAAIAPTDSGSSTPSEVETPVTGTETAETTAEGAEGSEQEANPDGTPRAKVDGLDSIKSPNLASIRTTLKNLRDSVQDPESVEGKATLAAVKELHGSLERWNVAKEIFPKGVAEMKQTSEFLKELSGGQPGLQAAQEGWARSQEQLASAEATDALLYEGNSELIANLVEDLKGQNKLDALGKLAPSFLDALKQNDSEGYYRAFAPHLLSGLREAGVPSVINSLARALASGDTAQAKSLVSGVAKWFNELNDRTEQAKTDPLEKERRALAEDKKAWESGKVKETQTQIASTLERSNNSILGSELKSYLRMPFFKAFSKENLIPLGNQIKSDLYSTLKADKAYQAQMKAMWGSKTPDKAKIAEYHKVKLESISATTVRNAVQRLYPGYSKGGSAAGRIASAEAAKQKAALGTAPKAGTPGSRENPLQVAVKPAWDSLDFSRETGDFKEYNYISGRGRLKSTGKWVSWRKP